MLNPKSPIPVCQTPWVRRFSTTTVGGGALLNCPEGEGGGKRASSQVLCQVNTSPHKVTFSFMIVTILLEMDDTKEIRIPN